MPASQTKTSVRSLTELAAVVPYTLVHKVHRSVVLLGASVGDAPNLLDVDVDHVTGTLCDVDA